MRTVLLALITIAACSGAMTAPRPDASAKPADAGEDFDAEVDAPADAPVDADPPPDATRCCRHHEHGCRGE